MNHIAFDSAPEPGFVIARLKRALPFFDDMMKALQRVRKRKLLPDEWLTRFSDDMFALREVIVQLMERFRSGFNE